ncbi:hypothetical protein A0H81_02042 [Grifola frondosa]|uniref:Autophagy-related protein 27 n=1 Tax=Grifola frondosa TaxID=5627 RepID=A0A1C7MQL0_GRIFR|nr:hypothetical protein A0H81_02042 [Grifola frondosa]
MFPEYSQQCSFTLGDQRFDLCPIVNGQEENWSIEFEQRTPPTLTKTAYKISLRGPLQRDKALPRYEQCPDGAWICMTVSNRRSTNASETPRVLQVVPVAGALSLRTGNDSTRNRNYYPGLNVSAELTPSREDSHHEVLHIRLHGGYYVNKYHKADFQFRCDHTAEEPSSPTYYWNWNGTHSFSWRTKYACGKQIGTITSTTLASKPTSEPEPENDAPPIDDDIPDGEQELVDPGSISRRFFHPTMMVILSSVTAVFLLAYLVYFPPAVVRRRIVSFIKSHPRFMRFRLRERVLVRWAYEDLELETGEEDVMVNAEEPLDMQDEQIPLKPSPRRNAFMNYGSAT